MTECCICTADVQDRGILMMTHIGELKFLCRTCALAAIIHEQGEVVGHWGITPLEEAEG